MDLVGPTFFLPAFLKLCPEYQILPFEYQFLMDVVGPKFQPVFDGRGRSQKKSYGKKLWTRSSSVFSVELICSKNWILFYHKCFTFFKKIIPEYKIVH